MARKLLKEIYYLLGSLFFIELLMAICSRYLAAYYRYLFRIQWVRNAHPPHWFDHRINLYTWFQNLDPNWIEKGIYSREPMFPGCSVLDIGCGDGFYAHYFYASLAASIDSIDIEESAIAHAEKYHKHPKIRYFKIDAVLQEFPEPSYDVVCLDGALGHFSAEQIDILMKKIKKALGGNGVFVGNEVAETTEVQSWDHLFALPTEKAFHDLLSNYFSFVETLIGSSTDRVEIFFRCSENSSRIKTWKDRTEA